MCCAVLASEQSENNSSSVGMVWHEALRQTLAFTASQYLNMCLVQAKEAEVLGHCNLQHAARKQYTSGLQAKALDNLQDDVPLDQVRQSSLKTFQSHCIWLSSCNLSGRAGLLVDTFDKKPWYLCT